MCDCSTIQIPLHLNHLCKPDPPYMMLMPVSKGRGEGGVCTSCLNAHRPQRQRNKTECLFALRSDRLAPPPPPPAAGLRSRADESDQSDQSTQITVIPEVRRRATGHSEFTQPTQALGKSVQEWQTCARPRCKSLTTKIYLGSLLWGCFFFFLHLFNRQPSRNGHITSSVVK